MGERVETKTQWACDRCDRIATFMGRNVENTGPPEPPQLDIPRGWTEMKSRPLNDRDYKRQAGTATWMRLYCDRCSERVVIALDALRHEPDALYGQRETVSTSPAVIHIQDISTTPPFMTALCADPSPTLPMVHPSTMGREVVTCRECRGIAGWGDLPG